MKPSTNGDMAPGDRAERWQIDDCAIETMARRPKHGVHALGGEQVTRVRDPLPQEPRSAFEPRLSHAERIRAQKKAAAPHLRYWGLRAPARYTRGSNCRKQIGTDLQLTERIRAGQWNFGTEVAFDYG